MPGLNSPTFDDSAATPGRRTRVLFDVAETVLIEPAWAEMRAAKEIHASTDPGAGNSYGVMQLQSGWWGLEPINAELYEQHEAMTDEGAGVMGRSEWNLAPVVEDFPTYHRPDDLPGALVGASPDLKESGDVFFDMLRPSDESWEAPLATALVAPPPPRSLRNLEPVEHILLDPVAESLAAHAPDTGYLLRWIVPGSPFFKPDWVLRFYFGGALTDESLGTFCLLIGGNGTAYLYEQENDTSVQPTEVSWHEREHWRYANPLQTVNVLHNMRILPHARRFIEFQSQLGDRTFGVAAPQGAQFQEHQGSPTTHLFTVPPKHAAKRAAGATFVTGEGPVHVALRRELRVTWQVSRLVYRLEEGGTPSGLLVDFPFQIPWGLQATAQGAPVPVTVRDLSVQTPDPLDSAVRVRLWDGETHAELELEGSEYLAPGGKNLLVPKIEMATQDKFHSPYLFSYGVSRPKVTKLLTPGEFTGGALKSLSLEGPDSDPMHEHGRLVIEDPLGELDRLNKRGLLSCEIRVSYDNDPDQETVVFSGYALSPRRRPMARDEMEFPTPDWAEYEIDLIGKWRRLQASLILQVEDYYTQTDLTLDPDALDPKEGHLPWKVTDVIRKELGDSGLEEDQIDVVDFPMRLWRSLSLGTETWRPATGTRRFDHLKQLAADYLGGYLLWDPNAGSKGMWRFKFAPRAGTPRWQFLTKVEPSPVPKLAHSLASYAPGTSPVLRVEGQPSLQTWVEPPEASAVLAMTPGNLFPAKGTQLSARKWAVNPKSVDKESWGTTADPEDPDYLGWFEPIIDTMNWAPDSEGGKLSAAWMARRLYDIACRARKMASWTGHFVLIEDPSDPQLPAGRRRPLRFGDTVTLGQGESAETYILRSVSPEWTKDYGGDSIMLARYSAQEWRPLQD